MTDPLVPDREPERIVCTSFGQLARGGVWRTELPHTLPGAVLYWPTRGHVQMQLEGRRVGLGAHTALFVPSERLLSFKVGPQTLGQAIFFSTSAAARLPEEAQLIRVTDGFSQAELTGLIDTIQRETSQGQPRLEHALEAYEALVAVWLHRRLPEETRLTASAQLSRAFTALAAQEATTGWTLERFAQELGVTATHLSRCVKTASGQSAQELLTQHKLYKARRLLEETQLTSAQIAAHLHFGSASYFARFIRHATGAPPSALRKPRSAPRL